MNEQEKKAIEKLKKIIEDTIKANECGLSNNDFKEEIEVYDTVLNLITKLQKENDLAKEQLKKQCKIADERNDLLVKVNRLESQIDLMANYIVNLIKYNNPEEIREVEELKQYFERKSEK